MIRVENLTVSKSRKKNQYILSNLSINFEDPKNVIIGPNGSGKTTLLKAILGIIKYNGEIKCYFEGKKCNFATNLDLVYRLYNDSVNNISKLYINMIGGDYNQFENIIETFKMTRILDTKIYKLSTGETKIFGLAMAYSLNADYILIDEPTENLDPSRRELAERLIEQFVSKRYLLVTHDLKLLKKLRPNRFFIMISGKIYGGFDPSIFDRLFISREGKGNYIAEIQGGFSKYYLSLDSGDFPLSSFSSIEEILGGE